MNTEKTTTTDSRPESLLRTVTVTDSAGHVMWSRTIAAVTPEDALTWVAGYLGNGDGAQ